LHSLRNSESPSGEFLQILRRTPNLNRWPRLKG